MAICEKKRDREGEKMWFCTKRGWAAAPPSAEGKTVRKGAGFAPGESAHTARPKQEK